MQCFFHGRLLKGGGAVSKSSSELPFSGKKEETAIICGWLKIIQFSPSSSLLCVSPSKCKRGFISKWLHPTQQQHAPKRWMQNMCVYCCATAPPCFLKSRKSRLKEIDEFWFIAFFEGTKVNAARARATSEYMPNGANLESCLNHSVSSSKCINPTYLLVMPGREAYQYYTGF